MRNSTADSDREPLCAPECETYGTISGRFGFHHVFVIRCFSLCLMCLTAEFPESHRFTFFFPKIRTLKVVSGSELSNVGVEQFCPGGLHGPLWTSVPRSQNYYTPSQRPKLLPCTPQQWQYFIENIKAEKKRLKNYEVQRASRAPSVTSKPPNHCATPAIKLLFVPTSCCFVPTSCLRCFPHL